MSKSLLKARARIVNFRVTEDEYEFLRSACIAQGSRSISEFAREATLRRVTEQQHADGALRGVSLEPSAALLSRVLVLLSRLADDRAKPERPI